VRSSLSFRPSLRHSPLDRVPALVRISMEFLTAPRIGSGKNAPFYLVRISMDFLTAHIQLYLDIVTIG
jgi:hypothetical protein